MKAIALIALAISPFVLADENGDTEDLRALDQAYATRWIAGGIDKLNTQPWPIRSEIACHAVAQFQDANARDRRIL